MPKTTHYREEFSTPYIAPKDLQRRWRCSRSTVDRIARRQGFTKLFLGEGSNGAVRYLTAQVEQFEQDRLIDLEPSDDELFEPLSPRPP